VDKADRFRAIFKPQRRTVIRTILGIVLGYVVMVVFIFCTFTLSYLVLGTERVFLPDSFEVSSVWLAVSFILNFAAAYAGGGVCRLIGRSKLAVQGLSGLVFVLGLLTVVSTCLLTAPSRRDRCRLSYGGYR
jgi:hypothetical protein